MLARPVGDRVEVAGQPAPVDHRAGRPLARARLRRVGSTRRCPPRSRPGRQPGRSAAAIASTESTPRSRPARSTTMPVCTSASSIIESASFSVVRRSSSGDIGVASDASSDARRGDMALADPADRAVRGVQQEQVGERVRERPGAGVTRGVADPGRHDRLERDLADPRKRQPLEAAIGTHEVGDELRRRGGEDLGRGPELLEVPADLHHGDQVAHLDRLVDVVGHEQDRLGQLRLEAQELVLEPLADDRVHGAERLVHEHEGRIGGQGAGDARRAAAPRRRAGPGSGRGRSPAPGRRARAAPPPAPAAWPRASGEGAARPRRSRRSSGAGRGPPAGSRSRSRAAARSRRGRPRPPRR